MSRSYSKLIERPSIYEAQASPQFTRFSDQCMNRGGTAEIRPGRRNVFEMTCIIEDNEHDDEFENQET